ncbi:MAG TPA: glycosyltransferase [Pyrinomonadaceae bacterium]
MARERRHFESARRRAVDWAIIAAGVTLSFALCWQTIDDPDLSLLWGGVLCFYFFFYRRMAQALYWSASTFRLLRECHPNKAAVRESLPPGELPTFHILIAAYEAGDSIGPVLKAAAHQDYPEERYYIWAITEHSEQLKKDARVKKLLGGPQGVARAGSPPDSLLPFFWRCRSQELGTLEAWSAEVAAGSLRGFLTQPGVWSLVLEDLLLRLLRAADREAVYAADVLAPLQLRGREARVIELELRRLEARVARTADDFVRLLGRADVCERGDLEAQLVGQVVGTRRLARVGKRLCRRLAGPSVKAEWPDADAMQRTAAALTPSTQEVIRQLAGELNHPHVRHLDPRNRGFKPGALNAAFRQIRAEGLLAEPENVYFVIIDADSLLPAHALAAAAREIRRGDHPPALLQMTSIPTANFYNGGWYSKFIAFADAIGAVGKWARSTRRRLKPDLQAGSGVVVPATLSQFIEAQTGFAWDETTLTEDARLIIGQFGMMNGVRNKTRMVPVFLLEAVPAGESFRRTYQSFWNQRRRWSVGGFDELFYLLRCPRWLRHTRFNPVTHRWEQYAPATAERVKTRLRQLHRAGLWLWDHFIWGIGGFIVLTHWWLISVAVRGPGGTIRAAGLATLLLSPLLFVAVSGRQLAWFIPGGLSARRMCLLYLQSFLAIWLYCLPAVATQLACIFGFRSRIVEWKPTQKPRYQLGKHINIAKK